MTTRWGGALPSLGHDVIVADCEAQLKCTNKPRSCTEYVCVRKVFCHSVLRRIAADRRASQACGADRLTAPFVRKPKHPSLPDDSATAWTCQSASKLILSPAPRGRSCQAAHQGFRRAAELAQGPNVSIDERPSYASSKQPPSKHRTQDDRLALSQGLRAASAPPLLLPPVRCSSEPGTPSLPLSCPRMGLTSTHDRR